MSGTINLTGPITSPGAPVLEAPDVNTAVNAALAFYAPLASPTFTGTVAAPLVNLDGGTVDGTVIGGAAPAAGSFTTLSASGAVSGAGFVAWSAAPGPIGSTTPAAGHFTTLSASGQLTSTVTTGTAPLVIASTTVVPNLNASLLGGANFGSPGAIGGSSPGAGSFTTLSATGLISPAATIGILGTAAANNAQAGSVGEFVTATVAAGSAVALTSPTAANVVSISLSAGDWDVWGTVAFTPAASTSITVLQGGINTSSGTLPAATTGALAGQFMAATVPGAVNPSLAVGTTRMSLAGTTTVFLVAQGTFTVSTLGAFGFIGARRVR